jgi:orotidine-5'-phosphate decarboxylase
MHFVTPGVRSVGKAAHDQKRVTTPRQAIDAGSTHLVIGRQVTEEEDAAAALDALEAELSAPAGGAS